MNYNDTIEMMIQDEGEKFQLYVDTTGNATIGIGYNIARNGISKHISREIFKECFHEVIRDLDLIFIVPGFFAFPDQIQTVLFNMRFQLGYQGFRNFKKMIVAVQQTNWPEMIKEMKDSRWYRNFTNRADRLIEKVSEVSEVSVAETAKELSHASN